MAASSIRGSACAGFARLHACVCSQPRRHGFGACANLFGAHADHPQRRNLVILTKHQVTQRDFHSLVKQFVLPERPEQRIAAHTSHQFGIARDDAGLGTAQELVSAERDEVCACFETGLSQRFMNAVSGKIHHTAASQIFVDRNTVFPAECDQFFQ